MTCRAWEDLLQRHLDGEPSDLRQHLLGCPDCAAYGADLARLLGGVARLKPPPVPPHLTDSVARALTAEARRRKRSRRWGRVAAVVGVAVAASLLLAVGVRWWIDRPAGGPVARVAREEEQPPPLRESVTAAGDAVTSLTKAAAEETTKGPASLLGAVKETARPLEAPAEAPRLERPMREAADGVKDGFAPVTDSARRAVGLFLRDLPGAKDAAE